MEKVRAQVGDGSTIRIVLDNASAHEAVSKTNFCAERGIELIFMPPYSPAFNSQERVWALFKAEYRRRLATLRKAPTSDEQTEVPSQKEPLVSPTLGQGSG